MFIEFSVSNFKSFKEMQTLSMLAQPLKHKYEWLDENIFFTKHNIPLLKTKAIFGANASGKSNLIKAIATFLRIVNNSVKDENILSLIEPFVLSTDSFEDPSFFQMVFLIDKVRYRYGFEADKDEIKNEWLFGKPGKKEVAYFIREGNEIIKTNETQFPESKQFSFLLNEDNEIVRNNALFLSAAASLNGKVSKKIVNWISKIIIISGIEDSIMKIAAYSKLENEVQKNKVVKFLNAAGIDIEDFIIKEFDGNISTDLNKSNRLKILTSIRTQYGSDNKPKIKIGWSFSNHESDGTQKMLHLSPFILDSLEEGRTLILDEFEARLHTTLSRNIVQLYNSNHNNIQNAQFIFSSHDTNLLSSKLMRRDQISFVRKDKYGQSKVYSLADIKGIRNDESYEKNYLIGKYDAIPKIGGFDLSFTFNR